MILLAAFLLLLWGCGGREVRGSDPKPTLTFTTSIAGPSDGEPNSLTIRGGDNLYFEGGVAGPDFCSKLHADWSRSGQEVTILLADMHPPEIMCAFVLTNLRFFGFLKLPPGKYHVSVLRNGKPLGEARVELRP